MTTCSACDAARDAPLWGGTIDHSLCRSCAALHLNFRQQLLPTLYGGWLLPIPPDPPMSRAWGRFCYALGFDVLDSGRRAWSSGCLTYVRGAEYVLFDGYPSAARPWTPEPRDIVYADDVLVLGRHPKTQAPADA